jgi:hypothetical protein
MSKPSPDEQSVSRAERALARMTDDLRRRWEELRRHLAEVGRKDIQVRHRLGELVNEIQHDPDKYGQRGVKRLAAAIGYDAKTCTSTARSPAAGRRSRSRSSRCRRGVTGLPVSFSHLLLIATVTTKRRRASGGRGARRRKA